MLKHNLILIFLFLGLITACKKEQPLHDTEQDLQLIDTTVAQTQDNEVKIQDLIEIQGKQVVFFMPPPEDQKYLMSFYGQVAQWEFQAMFRDQRNLANAARKALSKYGIKSFLTYSKKFEIKLDTAIENINLGENSQILGFILADSSKYKVCYGLYNNKSFIKEIRDFYNIPFTFSYRSVQLKNRPIQKDTNTNAAP